MVTAMDTTALTKLGEDLAAAELRGDVGFLASLATDDFICIGPRGFMLNKTQWLGRYASGDFRYRSYFWDDEEARVYGDAAVMIGSQVGIGEYKEKVSPVRNRGTLVFVRQDGDWRLVSLHYSPLAEEA